MGSDFGVAFTLQPITALGLKPSGAGRTSYRAGTHNEHMYPFIFFVNCFCSCVSGSVIHEGVIYRVMWWFEDYSV